MQNQILIVDDHPPVCTSLSQVLNRAGYKAHIANNGFEAMEAISRERFSVVVTDMDMPRMDGLAVLKHIREDEGLRRLPVVILTTSKDEEDRLRSYDLGANAYIMKPVGFHNFSQAVRTINLFWELVELPEWTNGLK